MNQTTFTSSGVGDSQCSKIEAYLKEHPGEMVPMPQLYEVSGAFAVHSRIADLRRRGMKIENVSERVNSKIHSFYIYTP